MALGVVELSLALLGLVLTIYHYLTVNHGYWESRGVKGPKPTALFGTVKDITLNKCCMGDYLHKVYKDWKNEPLVGIYLHRMPGLVVHDLNLVKDVMIKDFSKFVDRGNPMNDKIEPLTAHLFNIESTRWRPLRTKLSPVFTSGKLKEMFHLLVQCADRLDEYLYKEVKNSEVAGNVIEVSEISAKFTTDVIGVCAFGLRMNAIGNEDSLFRTMGRRAMRLSWKPFINFRLRHLVPGVYNVIGHLLVDREMVDFFVDTTKQTMEYREKNGVVKNDLVDLLRDLKNHPEKMADIELTDSFLAAQLFVFFIAGFDTSSSTISNTLYELARNQEVQDKLRREINEEMDRTGGIMEYEGIKNMTYLDMVLQETLRMYPPVNMLTRKSTESYTFKTATNENLLTIDKGQMIWIPIYAIHRDPQYFPEPDVYDPERFTPEAIKSRLPMTYLPFGDGPRNCIGKRFGIMQTKVGIMKILHRCKVDVCEKTQIPYLNDPKTFLLTAKNGIHLKLIWDTSRRSDLQ